MSNILVLGPGQHREFGFQSLRNAGHTIGIVEDLAYFDPESADWHLPYPPAAMRAPVSEIGRSGIAWDLVLAWGEFSLRPALRVAEQLGLPSSRLDAECFRDKAVMRQRQAAAGLRAPGFFVADSVRSARDWAGDQGLPVIVKPADYAGSSGVRLARSRDELEAAVSRALGKSFSSRAIIETFIDGHEYSVETVSFGAGYHHSYGVVEKTVTPLPYRVETGHLFPAELADDVAGAIISEVHRTLDVFGMETGASHAEVKLARDGPCVIEIGGRLAGDYIPQLIWLAGGVNLYLEELRAIQGGEAPAAQARPEHAAAMRVLLAEPGSRLRWPDTDIVVGTVLEHMLAGLYHWYPDYSVVPVIDGSARRLGACLLSGPPELLRAACDAVKLLEPESLTVMP